MRFFNSSKDTGLAPALLFWSLVLLSLCPRGPVLAQEGPLFEVTVLNSGIERRVPPEELATPQATLEYFMSKVEGQAYALAAETLNLGLILPELQAREGPTLARRLGFILRSEGIIDWRQVPDTRDGAIDAESATGSDRRIGPRRTILLGQVRVDGRYVPINLQRYKAEGEPPVWLFSDYTVEHIDEIFEAYGPGWLARQIPDEDRWNAMGDVAWWEVASLAVLSLLAVICGFALYKLCRAVGRRAGHKSAFAFAVGKNALLIALALGTIVLTLSTSQTLYLSDSYLRYLEVGLSLIAFAATVLLILRLLSGTIDRYGERLVLRSTEAQREARSLRTNLAVAKRLVVVLAFIVALAISLQYFQVFDSFGASFLVSTGAITVLVAIAARPILGNLAAALEIGTTKPVEIGDIIVFQGEWGEVKDVTFSYTVIETWTQRRLIVPHSKLLAEPFENWTKNEEAVGRTASFHVDFDCDLDFLKERIEGFLKDDERSVDAAPRLLVYALHEDSIELMIRLTARNSSDSWDLLMDLQEAIVRLLQSEDSRAAKPRRRILIEGESPATGEPGAEEEASGVEPRKAKKRDGGPMPDDDTPEPADGSGGET